MRIFHSLFGALVVAGFCLSTSSAAPPRVLFLGDNAGHRPTNRFAIMQPALASRGIEMTYTDKLDSLNATNLARYDALVIYMPTTPASRRIRKRRCWTMSRAATDLCQFTARASAS